MKPSRVPGPQLPLGVTVVLGTRPEAIKLHPVIRCLRADARFHVRVVATGQHREMLRQVLEAFSIEPDVDLDIMQPGQTLNEIVRRVVPSLDDLYGRWKPDIVVVQGDTTTAFGAALAAFHRQVPVAHVEAGLRSRDRFHPYPEEVNRRMISALADVHLAPTAGARANLRAEGIEGAAICVTGNTAVDSLLLTLGLSAGASAGSNACMEGIEADAPLVLITVHRRESWLAPPGGNGARSPTPMERICSAIAAAAADHPDVEFVYPVHRNPSVGEVARRVLCGVSNVHLIDPVEYVPFVGLMARAKAIVTDSGGIQEEAPSLGVPVLIVRETTERPEACQGQGNTLIGTSPQAIRRKLHEILDGARPEARPLPRPNPYGDGKAAERCRDAILHFFERAPAPVEFVPPGRA